MLVSFSEKPNLHTIHTNNKTPSLNLSLSQPRPSSPDTKLRESQRRRSNIKNREEEGGGGGEGEEAAPGAAPTTNSHKLAKQIPCCKKEKKKKRKKKRKAAAAKREDLRPTLFFLFRTQREAQKKKRCSIHQSSAIVEGWLACFPQQQNRTLFPS